MCVRIVYKRRRCQTEGISFLRPIAFCLDTFTIQNICVFVEGGDETDHQPQQNSTMSCAVKMRKNMLNG